MDQTITEAKPELSLFLPVLDEEENLRPMHAKIQSALDTLGKTAEVIYVDDGSTDKSLSILKEIAAGDNRVRVISLRRNYGQTAAMSAGISCSAKCAAMLDVALSVAWTTGWFRAASCCPIGPSRPCWATKLWYAAVVMWNPLGTGKPAETSRAKDWPLPPSSERPRPSSARSRT